MSNLEASSQTVAAAPEIKVKFAVVVSPEPVLFLSPAEPSWLMSGHIPILDGLRAVSILLVLIAHLAQQGTFVPGVWQLKELGHFGVDMFFVLSGFIITVLLLREQRRKHSISLTGFYLRRAVRILPAYGVFLLGMGILAWTGGIVLQPRDWIASLTYTISFLPQPSWEVGHLWSLSVEEHFYLLWPIVVVWQPRRAWMAAVATIALTPLLRWWLHTELPALDVAYCTLTRMDTIAIGCVLAYLVCAPIFRRLTAITRGTAYRLTALLIGMVVASQWIALRNSMHEILLHPAVVASCYAGVIWIWLQHENSWLGKGLQCKPIAWLGLLSYSIYLWQQPLLNPHSEAWITRGPLNVMVVMVLACASYLLVERPLLRLKNRLHG